MITVKDLKKTYDKRSKNANQVLHGLSFTLPDRGFICILGASGCGKTSLLNAIGGLDSFDSGCIITDNAQISRSGSRTMEKERNKNFGYIFQSYYLLPDHSAAYNVYLGMHSMPMSKKEKLQRARWALEKVDMLRYRKRPVGQLSGGQQQRVAIARAIARSPKVIFADEPTGNLDEANTINICTILKELSHDSLVVMVTHEERIARFFADRIITIEDGRMIGDSTDWARESMDAGEKGAVYAGEYNEERHSSNNIELRVLSKLDSHPVSLTVITEKDRLIIKTDDPRVVICSETNAQPKLIEGNRPVLDQYSFKMSEHASAPASPEADKHSKSSRGKGLGLGLLLREAKSLASSRRLGRIGMSIFIILLSLMVSVAVSDIVTLAAIDPENFIITDSHMLELSFGRGEELPTDVWDISPYRMAYREHLEKSGLEFDYVINTGSCFKYTDTTVPQLGELHMEFDTASYVNISRLDPSTLISGRMPQRYDEIVIDRWLTDKYLDGDGILQNIIPNRDYFLGKTLTKDGVSFMPRIVGICDSGEPTIYMSTEAMLSHGTGGMEVMSFSEFVSITGYDKYDSLAANECIIIADNAGSVFTNLIGTDYYFGQDRTFFIKDAPTKTDDAVSVKYVVADEVVLRLFDEMIASSASYRIWCKDKAAMLEYISNGLPEELEGLLDVDVEDKYSDAYEQYRKSTSAKLDARTIVTATVLALSVVMLYLMQRSKINEHMDLVAVYRLLGIPKRSLVFVFAAESVALTLKLALPTVLAVWIAVNAASRAESLDINMLFPLSAVGVTLAAILAIRLLFSVIPVLRLLREPPARLAAKYDF